MPRWKTAALWALLPAVVVAAFGISKFSKPNHPILVAPGIIDLGLQDDATVATVAFSVRNVGGVPLQINNIRTSCACLAVMVGNGEDCRELQQCTLMPGVSETIRLKLVLHTSAGSDFRGGIDLHTNDPARPVAHIECVCRIQGHVITSPREVSVILPPGATATQTIDIIDTGVIRRYEVDRIESDSPGFVVIEEVNSGGNSLHSLASKFGKTVAQFRVRIAAPNEASTPAGSASIYFKNSNRPRLLVPIRVTSVPPFELTPKQLTLPVVSSDGQLFVARSMCRHSAGKPFDLSVDSAAEDLEVVLKPFNQEKSSYVVQVTWQKSDTGMQAAQGTRKVRLRARCDEKVHWIELPVRLRSIEGQSRFQ